MGRFYWIAAVAVGLSLVPWAVAQDSVTLTGVQGTAWDGVYMSPYYATVNGAQNTTVICNDFADESYLGSTWNANSTSLSNLSASTLGNTLWGSYYESKGLSATTIINMYDQAAWLTLGLLGQTGGSTSQAYYSFAVWAVFDPNSVLSWLKSAGDTAACNAVFGAGNNCSSAKVAQNSSSLLWLAQQNYMNGNYSNMALLTPLVQVNGQWVVCTPSMGGAGGNCPAQEFFEMVPEGGTALIYLLLAGAACFGAMFHTRNQRTKRATA
ncbi:MAG: hypothetical protein WA718_12865 [Terriglobales bacterium]